MKKVILTSACLLALAVSLTAQEAPQKLKAQKEHHDKLTAEQRAQKHVDELNSTVVLTDEQKPKVYDLALAKVKKADEIRAKYKGQPENKEVAKKELHAAGQEFHKNVKAILTPEQIEKLKAKNAERKTAGKAHVMEQD